MRADITPVILTFNEAPNIGRCLEGVAWAHDIVVVDSGSTDETEVICRSYPQVRFFTRPFDNHAAQWTFAVRETGVRTPWVLALDADYIADEAAAVEIERLRPGPEIGGVWVHFRYAVIGKVLRSGIYPPVMALFRKDRARYVQDGHTQRVVVEGASLRLATPFVHDDRKSLERWVSSQLRYAALEADKLVTEGAAGWRSVLRTRTPFAPLAMALYCLIWRGGLFEGPAGWTYALQRTIAEGLISAAYLDRALRGPRT